MKMTPKHLSDRRVLNLFLVDTSRSIKSVTKNHQGREEQLIDQLNNGLECFTDEIGGSEVAERVDIGLVSFGGEATVEQDFQPIKSSWIKDGPPTLNADGHTPMCEAVVKGLNNLESYMIGTDSTQERVFAWLITDGKPNETEGSKWKKTKRKVERRTMDDDVIFYAVGLGQEVDMSILRDLVAGVDDKNNSVLHIEEGQIREFFIRASESVKQNSENIGKYDYDYDLPSTYDITDDGDRLSDTVDDGSDKSQNNSSVVYVGTSTVTIGPKIGTGSEGAVYRIQGNSDFVLKIFDKRIRDEKMDKVRAMIKNPPIDPTYAYHGVASITWPQEIVEDPSTGAFLGYKMPYKDLADHKNASRYARENLRWNASDPEDRYKTALNLLRVVRAIHEQGHAIGDLNHQNILINDGYVSVIDCDAFHILHADINKTYGDDVYFPRYAPPEGRGKTLRAVRRGDRFGIAIHLFQLLMEGFHPFQAQGDKAASGGYGDMIEANRFPYIDPIPGEIEPHSAAPDYSDLPAEVRQLFSDCFCETAKEYTSTRPSLEDWRETLENLLLDDDDV